MTVPAAATRPQPTAAEVKKASGVGQLETAASALDRAMAAFYEADCPLAHAFASDARRQIKNAITAAQ